MQTILATTKALNYSGQLLAKTHDGLRRIAKLGTLNLLHGSHTGESIGEVTNLLYRRGKDGLGYLLGTLPDHLPVGWGCSMQYSGSIRGGKICMHPEQQGIHVAILSNPRDELTVRDSSDGFLFTDSADSADTDLATGDGATAEVPATVDPVAAEQTESPSVEVSPDDLITAILADQASIDLLLTRLVQSDELVKALSDRLPKPEVPVVTRLVVTAKQPDRIVPVAPLITRPKQQPFQPIG